MEHRSCSASILVALVFSLTLVSANPFGLVDTSVYDPATNTMTSSENNFEIFTENAKAQDVDRNDITQYLTFTWNGGATLNTDWLFVYNQPLESGRVDTWTTHDKLVTESYYYNATGSMTVYDVISFAPSLDPCNYGNLWNRYTYEATQLNGTVAVYCFNSYVQDGDDYTLTGNYTKIGDRQVMKSVTEWVDVTDSFSFLGSDLLGHNFQYYYVSNVEFDPGESYRTRWTYTPYNRARSGKWYVFGKPHDLTLQQAISSGQYIFQDPWWDSNWGRKKEFNITCDSSWTGVTIPLHINGTTFTNMNENNTRITNGSETGTMYHWSEPEDELTDDHSIIWANLSCIAGQNNTYFYYYDYPAATSTANCNLTWVFCDDFNRANSATTGWNEGGTAAGAYSDIINNEYVITDNGANYADDASPAFSTLTKMRVISRMKIDGLGDNRGYFNVIMDGLSIYSDLAYYMTVNRKAAGEMAYSTNQFIMDITANTYYRVETLSDVDTSPANDYANITYVDNVSKIGPWQVDINRAGINHIGLGTGSATTSVLTIDWVVIGRWINNTQWAITWGAEESGAPTVTFNSQTPNDISSFAILGNPLVINYTISDGINESRVRLWHKTNSTDSECWIYTNGSTEVCGYKYSRVGISNTSDTWLFTALDNEVYPGTYNYNETYMEATSHSAYVLDSLNEYMKIRLFNVSNSKEYSIFEVMANTSGSFPLRVYYCNSSYTTGNPATNANCINFYNLVATDTYNHTHSTYSKHQAIPVAINTTTGEMGGVYVTPTSYFLLRGTPPALSWDVYYISNISRVDTTQYSTNRGSTWTNFAGTVDAHLHQYDGNDTFYYFVEACDITGSCTNSSVRNDLIDLYGLPPTAPDVYNPVEGSYVGLITINYTASQSPNSYPISYYNLSLVAVNTTFVQVIHGNNSDNLSYTWDSSSATDGDYMIRVEGCDNVSQCSYGYSENITIDNTNPLVSITSPSNGSLTSTAIIIIISHTETNPHTLTLNFDGTNQTQSYSGAQTSITKTVARGTSHWFIVYVNDTVGNTNQTGNYSVYTPIDIGAAGSGSSSTALLFEQVGGLEVIPVPPPGGFQTTTSPFTLGEIGGSIFLKNRGEFVLRPEVQLGTYADVLPPIFPGETYSLKGVKLFCNQPTCTQTMLLTVNGMRDTYSFETIRIDLTHVPILYYKEEKADTTQQVLFKDLYDITATLQTPTLGLSPTTDEFTLRKLGASLTLTNKGQYEIAPIMLLGTTSVQPFLPRDSEYDLSDIILKCTKPECTHTLVLVINGETDKFTFQTTKKTIQFMPLLIFDGGYIDLTFFIILFIFISMGVVTSSHR